MNYYTGSLVKALVHAYPEIGFNENKFPFVSSRQLLIVIIDEMTNCTLEYYWQDKSNRRKLLEEYAVSKKFDPLIPTNWYSITFRDLLKFKVWIIFPILL